MSKTRRWVIILLSLAILVLIGINLADKDDPAAVMVNSNDPTYKSEHTDTVVYSPEGALSYRLIAQQVADGDQLLGVLHMHDLLRAGVV